MGYIALKQPVAPKQQAGEIVDDIARKWCVTTEEIKSRRRHPTIDKAKAQAYFALRNDLGWSLRRIGQFMGGKSGANIKIVLDGFNHAPEDLETEAKLLRFRLNQLSGVPLVGKITDTLGINLSQAIILSIIVESYPSSRSLDAMCDLYEHAWRELTGEPERFVEETSIKSLICKIRRTLKANGYPMPIVTTPASSYVLTDEFAFWARLNLGRPYGVNNAI